MAGIAIPQEGSSLARRTLGSFAPHPATIGKVMGARIPHLAGGGITNAENISSNLFQPINAMGGVPNADVNFITSPQLGIGHGAPNPPSSQPKQGTDSMQQIAEGTQSAKGLTDIYNSFGGKGINKTVPSMGSQFSMNTSGDLLNSGVDAASSDPSFWSTAAQAIASFFASSGGAVPGYAEGGEVNSLTNMLMRREAGETFHPSGFLNSAGPGRTDTINTNVPTGAYVIPADVVSGLGEGNSLAGSAVIDRMFSTAPHGVKEPHIGHGRGAPAAHVAQPSPPPHGEQPGPTVNTAAINSAGSYAKGGKSDKAPVVVAGGEHVLSPQQIIAKFGSLKKGHRTLDHWVVLERKRIAQEMLKLAPPVGSRIKKDEK